MLEVMKKYSGVLFFYLAIVGMILLINLRFSKMESTSGSDTVIAMSEWLIVFLTFINKI